MIEIVTDRLRIRPFRGDDLPTFVAYRRDPGVARYQSWDTSYSFEDAERFLALQVGLRFGQPAEWFQLAITDRETGLLYGDCAVLVVSDQPATAEVAITLAKRRQGSGVGTEALAAVVSVLFEQHGMHRVYAQADERNGAVHRLLERMGFRLEGCLVEADWFKGEWASLRIYAVLDHEWSRCEP